MENEQLNCRLFLKETPISSGYEVFHKFAENFIFFRWSFFKNRPRTTFLLIRAVLVNTLIFGLYYCLFSNIQFLFMGIEVDPILLYSGGCILGYWNMSWSFANKCNYLSALYNDIIKEQGKNNLDVVQMLSCNFVAQLLTMDLWGHRLYSWTFINTVTIAAKWSIQNGDKYSFKSFANFVKMANSGKLEVALVRSIVIDYQVYLANRSQNSYLEAA